MRWSDAHLQADCETAASQHEAQKQCETFRHTLGRSAAILLGIQLPISNAPADESRIPQRDPAAGPELIDLSLFYNEALTETWPRTWQARPVMT